MTRSRISDRGARLSFSWLLLVTSCAEAPRSIPFYRTADLSPEWLDAKTALAPETHRVGSFRFIDQSGATIGSANLKGHISLVSFFFTACGNVCPMTRTNISAVLARFPDESRLQVLFHSVTPTADSLTVLEAYAKANNLTDTRWHLLTGRAEEMDRVARDGYFVNLHDGSDFANANLAHTESILLIDSEGRIRGVYSGSLRLEVDRIAADLKELLASD